MEGTTGALSEAGREPAGPGDGGVSAVPATAYAELAEERDRLLALA